MKKTYFAPKIYGLALNGNTICLTLSDSPADFTPAGAKYHKQWTADDVDFDEENFIE